VIIFDIGPQLPVQPVKPPVLFNAAKLSPGADGDPRIEPELRRYADAYRNYLAQTESFEAERKAWEREAGGAALEIACDSVSGGEMLERGHGRYVATLPFGVKLGPRSGSNRIVHSYEAG
jgi:hypothetical protein